MPTRPLYKVPYSNKIRYLGKYNNSVSSHDSCYEERVRLTIVQFVGLAALGSTMAVHATTTARHSHEENNAQQSRCHFSTTHAANTGPREQREIWPTTQALPAAQKKRRYMSRYISPYWITYATFAFFPFYALCVIDKHMKSQFTSLRRATNRYIVHGQRGKSQIIM